MERSYKFLGSQGYLETNIKVASIKVACFVISDVQVCQKARLMVCIPKFRRSQISKLETSSLSYLFQLVRTFLLIQFLFWKYWSVAVFSVERSRFHVIYTGEIFMRSWVELPLLASSSWWERCDGMQESTFKAASLCWLWVSVSHLSSLTMLLFGGKSLFSSSHFILRPAKIIGFILIHSRVSLKF